METKVKSNDKGNNNNAAATAQNGQKVNNLPVSNAFNDKKEELKGAEAKPQAEATNGKPAEQPKAETTHSQAEPTKKEIKEQLREQQARQLAETVKLVETLGKKIAQKNKLQNTIANLDSFVVSQNEDDDMASDSRFARCELIIHDDNGEEFVTKNPFVIAYVAHEVKQLCIDKLAEVEAGIVIPV